MIELALKQHLAQDSVITSFIQSEIYVQHKDNNKNTDFMTINEVNQVIPLNVALEKGQKRSLIQIDFYMQSGLQLRQLKYYLLGKLTGASVTIAGDYPADIQLIELNGTRNDYNGDDKQYHASLDFEVHYH